MKFKSIIVIALAILLAVSITGCISLQPCDICNHTPSKSFFNQGTGKTEYYCSQCSSRCAWCGGTATKSYTGMMDMIIFVCPDCYEEITK